MNPKHALEDSLGVPAMEHVAVEAAVIMLVNISGHLI